MILYTILVQSLAILVVPSLHVLCHVFCRDEQYKTLWAELENFLSLHAVNSSEHQDVYECLLQCLGKSDARAEM